MPLSPSDQFHVGIIVDDFEGARSFLTDTCGYEWGLEVDMEYSMVVPRGPITYRQRLTYSITEPRLEIVQSAAGTPFQPSTSGLHHVGYWCDDVAATSAELAAQGGVWECGGTFPDGSPAWAYHLNPLGVRIELVSTAMQESMAILWSPATPN